MHLLPVNQRRLSYATNSSLPSTVQEPTIPYQQKRSKPTHQNTCQSVASTSQTASDLTISNAYMLSESLPCTPRGKGASFIFIFNLLNSGLMKSWSSGQMVFGCAWCGLCRSRYNRMIRPSCLGI